MPELVVSARSMVPARWRANLRVNAHLVLDEALLRLPDGTSVVPLVATEDRLDGDWAQAVAEAPLSAGPFTGSPTRDLDELARLVAAVSKLDVYADVAAFVHTVRLLRHAATHVGATRIVWLAEDASLARAVASRLGLRTKLVVVASDGAPDGRSEALIRWLKRRRLEWTMRGLTSVVDGAVRISTPRGRPVLTVFDVRNDGMIANVARVAEGLAEAGTACAAVHMDRRVGAAVARSAPSVPSAPFVRFSRIGDFAWAGARTRSVRQRLLRRWTAVAGSDPDVEAAARFAFRRLSGPYVFQTLLDVVAAERLLAHTQPIGVVVASDAHRYARLLVLLAGSARIRTAVVQHGALVLKDFYLPLVADEMLAWGPWCAAWFVSNGTDPGRVHATGFVRSTERRSLRPAPQTGARWLFAAQPIPDTITESLLNTVRVALSAHRTAHLVVRPHPGESRRAALSSMVGAWPEELRSRVSISPRGRALGDDLDTADLCIISQSTVGIDALAAGVPVVMLEHPDVPTPIPFGEFGALVVAGADGDLAVAVRGLSDPATVAALGRNADTFLDAYVGRSGVAAVHRIVAHVAAWSTSGRDSSVRDADRTRRPEAR